MPFYISMAFKNIFRDRRRSFTLGINYFFVALLLLLVFSATNGVRKNIAENVVSSAAGHITVSGEYVVNGRIYQGIAGFQRIDSLIRGALPDARVFSRYTLSSAVYFKSTSKRISFVGIDPAFDRGLRDQIDVDDSAWTAFMSEPNAVAMPRSIAGYFGLGADDDVLIAARTRFGAFNTGTIRVKAFFTTGNYFLRDNVIGHFGFFRSLDLADGATASRMFVFLKDRRSIAAKRDRLLTILNAEGFVAGKPETGTDAINAVAAASPRQKKLDESVNQKRLTLATIDEVTGIVSKVIAAVNGIGLFIAAIMLFIIAVSIFINLRMTINERLREIGTLRAMGAERHEISRLFITENVFLSMVFVGAGIVAGFILMGIVSTFISMPADGTLGLFLNRGRLVLAPTAGAVFFIMGALVFLTMLFAYFPARGGGRISAVDALNSTK
jgi:putative ABC transport system permease protein